LFHLIQGLKDFALCLVTNAVVKQDDSCITQHRISFSKQMHC
jgi:hypothetical protein